MVERMGGGLFLCPGWQIEQQKNYKNKTSRGIRWPLFNILHSTTNQKHPGVMEKRWDRTREWVVMLGERDSIILGANELGWGKKL
jgi:hypothetical protein